MKEEVPDGTRWCPGGSSELENMLESLVELSLDIAVDGDKIVLLPPSVF